MNKRADYTYKAKKTDFTEDMLTMSGGNKYHERTNLMVGKFINGLQGNISTSVQTRVQMKENSQKIFDMMKKEKIQYIRTLVKGEDNGHCRGIKQRIDPTTKYKIKQQMEKYKQIQEERMEAIRTMKVKRDKEKLEEKRSRIQERLKELGEVSVVGKDRVSFLNPFGSGELRSNLIKHSKTIGLPSLSSRNESFSGRGSRRVQIQLDTVITKPDENTIDEEEELLI